MNQFQILFLVICVSAVNYSFASENTTYNSITVFNFDAVCMEEYQYEVDREFIIDDNHKAYHVKLDAERTLVLKVMDRTTGKQKINTSFSVVYDCQSSKGIQPQFVVGINNESTPVFVKKDGLYYKVSFSEYNVDNDAFFSSFASPHHSLVYEYHHEYDPLEALRPVALDALDYDTRNYYYSTEQERTEYNFVYLQMYRDVCINRPFGVVTPRTGKGEDNPYKYDETPTRSIKTTTGVKQIYRTCQHPVEVKHIKEIGTTERAYEEDGKKYVSKLVSIDGVALETYLTTHRYHNENTNKSADLLGDIVWEYDLSKTPKSSIYQPDYIVGSTDKIPSNNSTKLSVKENVEKGVREVPTTYNVTNNTVKLNIPAVTLKGKKHIVQTGETLYSISQKYNMSVLDIKIDNQLSENTIEIGQELVIDKK